MDDRSSGIGLNLENSTLLQNVQTVCGIWGPSSLLFSGYRGPFVAWGGGTSLVVILTTYCHLVLRSGSRGGNRH